MSLLERSRVASNHRLIQIAAGIILAPSAFKIGLKIGHEAIGAGQYDGDFSLPYRVEEDISAGGFLSSGRTKYTMPIKARYRDVLKTAYCDTLVQLLGRPSGGIKEDDNASGGDYTEVAEYRVTSDEIVVGWGDGEVASYVRHILAHEWWHMASARVGPTWNHCGPRYRGPKVITPVRIGPSNRQKLSGRLCPGCKPAGAVARVA